MISIRMVGDRSVAERMGAPRWNATSAPFTASGRHVRARAALVVLDSCRGVTAVRERPGSTATVRHLVADHGDDRRHLPAFTGGHPGALPRCGTVRTYDHSDRHRDTRAPRGRDRRPVHRRPRCHCIIPYGLFACVTFARRSMDGIPAARSARGGRDGRPVAVGAGKRRALLAILLLHSNEVVSADRLIADLWGERPPATVAKSLHVYVSQLRKELGHGNGSGEADPADARGRLCRGGRGRRRRRAPLRAPARGRPARRRGRGSTPSLRDARPGDRPLAW